MSGPSETLDIASLLTIDVDAELRKLATAQLQGPWQIPAELVRRALAAGAVRVDVSFGRRRVRVEDDGTSLSEHQVRALRQLLDPAAAAELRHGALLELESAGAVALLALAGLSLTSLTLYSGGGGRRSVRLDVRRQGAIKLTIGEVEERPAATRIDVVAEGLDSKRAREWLADVGRFVGGALWIDGQPGPDGLGDYLVSAPVELTLPGGPVTGRIGIPHRGDAARLWVLQSGVVATHQGLTKAPTFEAILDLGERAAPRATAADLRELVAPILLALSEQAVKLMLRAAQSLPQMGSGAQARILRLLLQAARLGQQRGAIEVAPLIPCRVGHDEPIVWRSLAQLQRERGAEGRRPPIPALYPEQSIDEVIFSGRGAGEEVAVAILESSARSAITELFGLRFGPPPRQLRRSRRGRRLLGVLEGFADLRASIAVALHLGIGPPLAESTLSKAELRLLEHLRAVIPGVCPESPQEVLLCGGRGRIRQTRGATRRLLLPRGNPDVRACVRAVELDEAWVYPASLVLLGGRGLPSIGARSTWLRGWGVR